MNARQSRLDALRSLRERETGSGYGWVLSTDVPPGLQQSLQTAAAQGLVELADREVRAELSAYEGRPVLWAARLSAQGHDVLTYLNASPAPTPHSTPPAASEQVIELRPAQMDALRVYTNLAPVLRVAPADGLVERVRTAHFDRPNNRWRMTLTPGQIDSVAYAFHLRALSGSVAEANWFAREYGITYRVDGPTSRPRAVRPSSPTVSP
ncbi:DUF6417 family protein [Streptomyces sp. NPDC049915]|uniref:DUF6417 family protein n=1 Tax=Streptomyces sp. NPDC049915 TaxID=3155510 RepID=UPI003440C7BF